MAPASEIIEKIFREGVFEALGFGLHDGQLSGMPVLLLNNKYVLRGLLFAGWLPTRMPKNLDSPVHDVRLIFFALLLRSVLGNNRALASQDGVLSNVGPDMKPSTSLAGGGEG